MQPWKLSVSENGIATLQLVALETDHELLSVRRSAILYVGGVWMIQCPLL
jgi:hypothetical protein